MSGQKYLGGSRITVKVIALWIATGWVEGIQILEKDLTKKKILFANLLCGFGRTPNSPSFWIPTVKKP